MTAVKRSEKYKDEWPMLEFRIFFLKNILRIKELIRFIVKHRGFESLSLCVIFLNSITLASEDPVYG